MSVLSDRDLRKCLRSGEISVTPMDESAIGPSSIDLRLGSILLKYSPQTIELGATIPNYEEISLTSSGYLLQPGDFVLGMTLEHVHIASEYQAFLETKGDVARAGIQIANNDGHIDPGTDGHLTLEICNLNSKGVTVRLVPGIYVCQLFVCDLSSPSERPYRGKYAKQTRPTTYLP